MWFWPFLKGVSMRKDTIAAIATAMSDSGISIIRVSGEDAIPIVNRIFFTKGHKQILSEAESHTIHSGFIYDGEYKIDDVMVSVMKAPRSFTTEDVVEINCHGGVLVTNKVLETVIKNGARIADPGEFTMRAFLNGRIDLSKAEAIMDLIHAKSEYALKNSINQLSGSVANIIKNLREQLIYEIAFIESALDDPEHISLEGYEDKLSKVNDGLLFEIDKLIESAHDGMLLKEGINTVIVGKPNVGKSSFLNVLIGKERAIVTDIEGTTRDALMETVKIKDILLNIIDTAGIRETEDIVEQIGVNKAKEYVKDADLLIYIVDSSKELDQNDFDIMEMLYHRKSIILLNKNDLETKIDEISIAQYLKDIYSKNNGTYNNEIPIIKTSMLNKEGMDLFEKIVMDLFFSGQLKINDEVYITNMRHKEALMEAASSLRLVRQSLENHMPEDFYSIDLMNAYTSLGYILGEELGDDLVQEIFSKFCMGK